MFGSLVCPQLSSLLLIIGSINQLYFTNNTQSMQTKLMIVIKYLLVAIFCHTGDTECPSGKIWIKINGGYTSKNINVNTQKESF